MVQRKERWGLSFSKLSFSYSPTHLADFYMSVSDVLSSFARSRTADLSLSVTR